MPAGGAGEGVELADYIGDGRYVLNQEVRVGEETVDQEEGDGYLLSA